MGAFESGQAFLAGVLAKLPAELQAQAKELFEKPEAKDAVVLVGDGAMARPDYSKAMDALRTKEQEAQQRLDSLNQWWEANSTALQEYKTIKPEYERLRATRHADPADPDPEPVSRPDPVDPRKVVEEVLAAEGPGYVRLSAWLAGKATEHYQMFGEVMDVMAIADNPKLGKPIAGQPGRVYSLQDAYHEKYGERVAARDKELQEKRFNDEVEKRLKEERAKTTGHPFPLRGEAPSVLDVLNTDKGPAAHTLDTAVAEYERLQAERGSAG